MKAGWRPELNLEAHLLPLDRQNMQEAGLITPLRKVANGHRALQAPESQVPQKGTRVAPQILTDARTREVGSDRRNVAWSPENILVDTVARLQQDLADIRAESRQLRTLGVPPVVHTPRQAAFTTTKVPRFGGTTSWEQYRQVFDAIVLSNWWDYTVAALQLLSHLEGDALNVALLVPISRRTSRTGMVDALLAHYGSPGRLADYRRQFEKMTLFRSLLSGQRASGQQPRQGSFRRDWNAIVCFSCRKVGHSVTRCPVLDESFPFMLPGCRAQKTPGVTS